MEPEHLYPDTDRAYLQSAQAAVGVWQPVQHSSGARYYHNVQTNETSWTNPLATTEGAVSSLGLDLDPAAMRAATRLDGAIPSANFVGAAQFL